MTDHSYQGRQSALQVFQEFSGSNPDEPLEEDDMEVDEEQETQILEKVGYLIISCFRSTILGVIS